MWRSVTCADCGKTCFVSGEDDANPAAFDETPKHLCHACTRRAFLQNDLSRQTLDVLGLMILFLFLWLVRQAIWGN